MKALIIFSVILLSSHLVICEIRYCNDGLGECTTFDRCSNSTIFNDGSDHIGVRFNLELETNMCHYLEMCCDPEDVLQESQIFKLPVDVASDAQNLRNGPDDEPGMNFNTGEDYDSTTAAFGEFDPETCNLSTHDCVSFHKCETDDSTDGSDHLSMTSNSKCAIASQVCCEKSKNVDRIVPTSCGIRNKNGVGFTVTNSIDEAQFGELPWMAAILKVENFEKKYVCGGSLIDPHVILTAAHCVKDLAEYQVRLGEWDTQTTNEPMPHSDYEVEQIITHPEFGVVNLYNDIALIVLKEPVKKTLHINPICLPPQDFKFDGSCIASGWGADYFGGEAYRANLKKLELPVVDLRTCQDNLRSTKLGPRFKLHTSFMCAGGEVNVDTCTGDGGSPLVAQIPGKEIYQQAGIVAWGMECGQENVPGVYANVAKFRNWIDDNMNQLGFGTASYTAA